jgi:benzylsuccinate CoA-transferase BbsF subunit
MSTARILEGVRIIALEQVLQLPWATMLLAEMGAEVIRVESITRVQTREMRPFPENRRGEKWWNQSGHYSYFCRNKKSLTLDLQKRRGVELFRELVKVSDVVADNNRPDVMDRLGLGWETLRKLKPDLIMLGSTGYGQTGPWRRMGAFGRCIQPMSGLYHFTGYEGGPPVGFEDNDADVSTGWNNALAVLLALHHRRRTGEGMYIDMSMYETNVNWIGPALLGMQMGSSPYRRLGNAHHAMAPHGCYRCAGEDEWVVIAVGSDDEWRALARAIGKPQLVSDSRFTDTVSRWRHRKELDEILVAFTRGRNKKQVMHELQQAGVHAGAVMNAPDLLADPQLKARSYFEWFAHSAEWEGVGCRPYQGRPYRFSKTPGSIRSVATLGEHNREILGGLLGLAEKEIEELEKEQVIGTAPAAVQSGPYQDASRAVPLSAEKLVEYGDLSAVDPGYRAALGLGGARPAQ